MVASETISHRVWTTIGKKREVPLGKVTVLLRQFPKGLQVEGHLSETFPAAGKIVCGSYCDILAAHASIHHRDLNAASFASTTLNMLVFLFSKDLLMLTRSYLSPNRTSPHKSIHKREDVNDHRLIPLSLQRKIFPKGSQKDSIYMSFATTATRTQIRFEIQEDRKMVIGWSYGMNACGPRILYIET